MKKTQDTVDIAGSNFLEFPPPHRDVQWSNTPPLRGNISVICITIPHILLTLSWGPFLGWGVGHTHFSMIGVTASNKENMTNVAWGFCLQN